MNLFASFQVVNLSRSGVVNLNRPEVVNLKRSGVVQNINSQFKGEAHFEI